MTKPLRYISLFSGIEAASVAWAPLGWEPVAFAEIEPFPCEVLAARFPDVPNLGDVSLIDWSPYVGAVDLVVGGSPCQAFSVAGKRRGLLDARGQLMLEYVRAVHDLRPRWVLWENVPGVLSQSGGDAFDTLLRELADCGYSLAWRTLDAQFYGVAQRRRRVFLVGHDRAGSAAAVLFERSSLRWDYPSSKTKRQALASSSQRGARCRCRGRSYSFSAGQSSRSGSIAGDYELAPTLRAGASGTNQAPTICFQHQASAQRELSVGDTSPTLEANKVPAVCTNYGDIAGTLTARHDSSPCADRGANVICINSDSKMGIDYDVAPTHRGNGDCVTVAFAQNSRDEVRIVNGDGSITGALTASQGAKQQNYVCNGYSVRRLTPVECERLQGFPDNWTQLGETKDTPRYKALGNSMAVPVMRWIGERIQQIDALAKEV